MDMDGSKRIFQRLGPSTSSENGGFRQQQKVCNYWRQGRCNRAQCMFLHHELPNQGFNSGGPSGAPKRAHGDDEVARSGLRRNTNFNNNKWGRQQQIPNNSNHSGVNNNGVNGGSGSRVVVRGDKVCKYFLQGSCTFGDQCRFSHSWSTGDCFSLLTHLEGHVKDVTGITLPAGSDKLYTGSKDETVRVWDCQSGQCSGAITLGAEIGCMISEGPWVFVGLMNLVKAWNIQTNAELSLSGPVGQVYSLVVGNDLLMAGTQDGTILAWRFNTVTNNFEPAASLKGHTLAVVTMVVGANRLYSGSMDSTIRVWSLETLQCLQTLTDHSNVVMSVLCWDQFLLSCSLDKTIKVWAATDSGSLEVTYTHSEQHGLLTLCGMHDAEAKPVVLCSCNDSVENCIRVYDLPSFSERGKIYSKDHVLAIQSGFPGFFFTGDGTGLVRVWQWVAKKPPTM